MSEALPPDVGRLRSLRDGTRISVRPIEATDAADLERFHRSLSHETTRLRFFSPHPRLSSRELDRFTSVDHHDREALVMRAGEQIIAVGRYDRRPDRSEAEVAFVVADDHQGLGAATILLFGLAERARDEGIVRFVADTLAENRRMLAVFERTGWTTSTHFDSGVLRVTMDLGAGRESLPERPAEA
jgi:RimJ/RimL family protein N-acetyltransferase